MDNWIITAAVAVGVPALIFIGVKVLVNYVKTSKSRIAQDMILLAAHFAEDACQVMDYKYPGLKDKGLDKFREAVEKVLADLETAGYDVKIVRPEVIEKEVQAAHNRLTASKTTSYNDHHRSGK